jgi:hypothetical protein
MAKISSENLRNSLRNDCHFVLRKQCFHFSKLKVNLQIDFSCLIRTLNFRNIGKLPRCHIWHIIYFCPSKQATTDPVLCSIGKWLISFHKKLTLEIGWKLENVS